MKKYDYVLVGSGLYSGVFAYLAGKKGKKCLVVEKRDHIGGNIYCEHLQQDVGRLHTGGGEKEDRGAEGVCKW